MPDLPMEEPLTSGPTDSGRDLPPERTRGAHPTMKKFLLVFGILVVFIVQVVLSYFIMDMLFPSGASVAEGDHTEEVESDSGGHGADKEKKKGGHGKEDKKGKSEHGEEGGEEGGFGATYTMEDLILNPMGATGKRIFKISLALEYDAANVELPEELKTREPFIRDFLLEYLGQVPEDSLGDIRNRSALRDSLQSHINTFLEGGEINRVLFLDFIRQ